MRHRVLPCLVCAVLRGSDGERQIEAKRWRAVLHALLIHHAQHLNGVVLAVTRGLGKGGRGTQQGQRGAEQGGGGMHVGRRI